MNKYPLICGTLAASACALAHAQGETTAQPYPPMPEPAAQSRIEAYASHHSLTGGFADWREAGLRGWRNLGPHILHGEVATMRRFGESGVFAGVGDTYTFNPDWYGELSVGAGNASYLPRFRVDGFINRKLLAERNLVATLGLAYYRAPDGHVDRSAAVGATYYFKQPLVVQGEVRFNTSSPGAVRTRRQMLAATWGREKHTQVVARHAWGEEGYQSLGSGSSLVNFRSNETSIGVRHWVNPHWGVAVTAERYTNPLYRRTGVNVALFRDLP